MDAARGRLLTIASLNMSDQLPQANSDGTVLIRLISRGVIKLQRLQVAGYSTAE
jgi:hypothetical protein